MPKHPGGIQTVLPGEADSATSQFSPALVASVFARRKCSSVKLASHFSGASASFHPEATSPLALPAALAIAARWLGCMESRAADGGCGTHPTGAFREGGFMQSLGIPCAARTAQDVRLDLGLRLAISCPSSVTGNLNVAVQLRVL